MKTPLHADTQGRWAVAEQLLGQAIADGVTPGAALLVGRGATIEFELYRGHLADTADAPVGPDTVYDLASLTKALLTVPAVLVAEARARLDLDQAVAAYLPEFAVGSDSQQSAWRAALRVRDLLWHCSGLPAHHDYSALASAEAVYQAVLAESLVSEPGLRSVYSDLGFLLLGRVLATVGQDDLGSLFQDWVLAPMNSGLRFLPASPQPLDDSLISVLAPTGYDSQGEILRGRVNDANARAMGGIAPHAGLFATARQVHASVAALFTSDARGGWLPAGSLSAAWQRPARTVEPSTWVLGWDTPSAVGSSAGELASRESIGHLGFTGTSVWIDRRRGVHVVLLTNRVHCAGDATGIRRLRPQLYDAVWKALD